jgi:hypothetical protein
LNLKIDDPNEKRIMNGRFNAFSILILFCAGDDVRSWSAHVHQRGKILILKRIRHRGLMQPNWEETGTSF